jgi:hypothetical protein
MTDYDPHTSFPPNLPAKPGPREGERGIGVGELWEPIRARGEDPDGYFHSIVWFPYDREAEAAEFAAANGYVMRKGVRL